jgi:hypothetical protein
MLPLVMSLFSRAKRQFKTCPDSSNAYWKNNTTVDTKMTPTREGTLSCPLPLDRGCRASLTRPDGFLFVTPHSRVFSDSPHETTSPLPPPAPLRPAASAFVARRRRHPSSSFPPEPARFLLPPSLPPFSSLSSGFDAHGDQRLSRRRRRRGGLVRARPEPGECRPLRACRASR